MKKIVLNQAIGSRENALVGKILNDNKKTIEERLNTLIAYNLILPVTIKTLGS